MNVTIGRHTANAFQLRAIGLFLKSIALFYAIGVIVPFGLSALVKGLLTDGASASVWLDPILATAVLTLAGLSLFSGYPWSALGRFLAPKRISVQVVLLLAEAAVLAVAIPTSICASLVVCSADFFLPTLLLFLGLDVLGLVLFLMGSLQVDRILRGSVGFALRDIVATCERNVNHRLGYTTPRSVSLAILLTLVLVAVLASTQVALSSNALSRWLGYTGVDVVFATAIITLTILAGGGLSKLIVIYLSPDARRILDRPHAKAVLLLRSFVDEGSRVGRWWNGNRMESIANKAFGARGAFVAIGDPKETIPTLGALRTYAADGDWQSLFCNFVDRSDTIIMIAGTSHWLNWELAQLQSRNALDRLIVAFPKYANKARLDAANCILGALGPSPTTAALAGNAEALLYLAFKNSGDSVVVLSEVRTPAAYRLGALLALFASRHLDGDSISV
jgi:hypothetical protein